MGRAYSSASCHPRTYFRQEGARATLKLPRTLVHRIDERGKKGQSFCKLKPIPKASPSLFLAKLDDQPRKNDFNAVDCGNEFGLKGANSEWIGGSHFVSLFVATQHIWNEEHKRKEWKMGITSVRRKRSAEQERCRRWSSPLLVSFFILDYYKS